MKIEVNKVLRMLLDQAESMYNNRSAFKLAPREVIHLKYRVSIPTDDPDYDDNIHFHIWFDVLGAIWFINNASAFPEYNKEWPFDASKGKHRRGYRRYFFGDIIDREVMSFFNKINDEKEISSIYTWGGAELVRETLSDEAHEMLHHNAAY